MVPMITIKKYMINEIMWEKLIKIEVCEILMNNRNIMFGLPPPYGKSRQLKMTNNMLWWMLKIFFDRPHYT